MNRYISSIFLAALVACGSDDADIVPTQKDPDPVIKTIDGWSVPISQVFDGGPGKDGILAIESPVFDNVTSTSFPDSELVVGIYYNGQARAYPHGILNYHEIVNDSFNGDGITISFCPLTGTAFGWESLVNGQGSTFGVSGLHYNNNLILYDRLTDSYWSQLKQEAIGGELVCEQPNNVQVIETTLGSWKAAFPETKILSEQTGINFNYSVNPYGNYPEEHEYILFPISHADKRLPEKERVHVIVDEQDVAAIRFSVINSRNNLMTWNSNIIFGDEDLNLMVSFKQKLADGTALHFSRTTAPYPAIFEDQDGTIWDVTGEGIEGPRLGQRLIPTKSFMSYWFPLTSILGEPDIINER